MATLDLYAGDFNPAYYDELRKLAAGKPMALAEVEAPPSPAILESQPDWTWWMIWAEMIPADGKPELKALRTLVNDPRSWSASDPTFRKAVLPVRVASDRSVAPLPPPPGR